MVILFNFLRNCHTIFHSGWTIYILISNTSGFQFLHILVNTCFFLYFGQWLSCECKVVSHCALISISLEFSDSEHSFTGLLAICMPSLENLYSSLLLIFELFWLFVILLLSFRSSYIFWLLTYYQIMICKYFLGLFEDIHPNVQSLLSWQSPIPLLSLLLIFEPHLKRNKSLFNSTLYVPQNIGGFAK